MEALDAEMEEIATNVKINRGIKLSNAAKSGRLAGGVVERTAQKWARRLKEDKDWNILEKQTNKINKSAGQLDEKHKIHLLNFYDSNPQARVVDAVCSLTEKVESFTLKESSVRTFDINRRPPGGWSIKGTPAIVITPTTRAVSHTVLGAISAKYVVSMELRNPQEHTFKRLKIDSGNRKRRAPSKPKKPASKGTVTGHYMNFI
ncbi:hypothetical protein G6F16_008111 [Rhizopus arrhizus]|nr:hypothetical protein G6F24_007878 [Rhizopus arrhizus]KAG0788984.1 hypothetical protein G6F21_006821 [Rhizopus arrhizus]KAG0790829.1 hypothetical protein G6F22_006305 [Rhizopus arrhizus]KAG0808130.1 hypothetical protein G6F20_009828 [Rhizopus arrhizus]KAG0823737.1 hypothetical protein G6F18_011174 [Rhizopus arrhizus]